MDFSVLEKTTDQGALLKLLVPFIDSEQQRYAPFHAEMEYNALFYLGKHWLVPKEGSAGFECLQDNTADDRFYPVTNYVKKLTDIKVNQIVGKRFIPVVKPNSLEPNDIERARLGHLALKAKNELDRESRNHRMAALHSALYGIGWTIDYKKPTGEYYEEPRMETVDMGEDSCDGCGLSGQGMAACPQCGGPTQHKENMIERQMVGPDGQGIVDRFPVYTSCSEVIDVFRIMVSRGPSNASPRWLSETSLQPVGWIKQHFAQDPMNPQPGFTGNVAGVKKSESVPRRIQISEDLKVTFEHKHSAIFGTVKKTGNAREDREDETLLHKFYVAPCGARPQGRLIIFTPTAVLYDGAPDVPEQAARFGIWFPHNPLIYTPHPSRYEGISFIGELIAKNKQLNALDAMILEHLDKSSDPQMCEFDNVMKNDDDNDGKIRLKPMPGLPGGGAPFYLSVNQLASELYNYRERIIEEMKEMANVTEVLQGTRPEGVDTYRGLAILRETSESLESDLFNRYADFVKQKSQLRLCLMQECLLQNDRQLLDMMKILADQEGMSSTAFANFVGADIGDQWSVVIEQTDYLSDTKSAEAEAVMNAVKSGVITPEELSDPLTKYDTIQKLGLGSSVESFGSDDIQKMNWMISQLEAQNFQRVAEAVQPFDNKPLQLRVLIRWMKKPKFYDLPQPVKNAAFALQKQLETAMMGQNTPPPGGDNAERDQGRQQ